jgi:hypothetical protein
MLPAYFAEGWGIAQTIVLAVAAKTAQMRALGDEDVKKNVMSSMVVYVILKLALMFFIGFRMDYTRGAEPVEDAQEPGPEIYVFVIAFFFVMVWVFRFFWLHVPLALGYSMRSFLFTFRAFASSFYFLGVWILCLVPLVFILLFVLQILSALIAAAPEGEIGFRELMFVGVMQVFDYGIILFSSIGIAFGVHSVYEGKAEPPKFFDP